MVSQVTVEILGKKVRVAAGSKADIARALLDQNYSVSAIAKAVPMAYSQVHSIAAKEGKLPSQDPERRASIEYHTGRKVKRHPKADELVDGARQQVLTGDGPPAFHRAKRVDTMESMAANIPTARQKQKDAKANREAHKLVAARLAGKGTKVPRIGKLRTPGLPSDRPVGSCANCGHDLVVGQAPTGFLLKHVNITTEEYLAEIQFCQAVPQVLM